MTRVKPSDNPPIDLEDDEWYRAVLVSAKRAPSKKEGYKDQIEVEWEGRQGLKLRDWIAIAVGQTKDGTPSRLRQLLNALAEKPRAEELWFDPDSLEWGYDLEGDDSTRPEAKITEGMVVLFTGSTREINGKDRYRISGYKSAGAKAKKP